MKHLPKTITGLTLAMALSLGLAACGSDEPASDQAEPLKVGMEAAYPPFNWTQVDDSNGAVQIESGGWAGGYDVEIAKLVAEAMGREIVVVKSDWDGLIPALQGGQIDMIVAGMSPTEERQKSVSFSDPYYTSDAVIVIQLDSPWVEATSLADFAGAKITAQLGTTHYDLVDQIPGVDKQVAMDSFPTMVMAVTSGKIDGYISERPGALSAVVANPGLTFVSFEEGQGFDIEQNEIIISIGVQKGSDLLNPINQALGKIDETQRGQLMADAIKNQP